MSSPRKPATIMVKKKPNQWQNSAAQTTARTVYVDNTQLHQADHNYQALKTKNIFLDTHELHLPHSSLQGTLKGSVASTEDFRHNLQTGSMALLSEEKLKSQKQYSKLSVKVKQTIQSAERNSNLRGTSQSIKSVATSQVPSSSKGILPTLYELSSPSNLRQTDPEQERRIKEQLDLSRFEGQKVLSTSMQQVNGAETQHIQLQKQLLTRDIIDASVTLSQNQRKVLLPALDSTKHNRHNTVTQVAEQSLDKKPRLDITKEQRIKRRPKATNYESNQIKTIVNETNILGRQSVKNLMQMYTPHVMRKELPALNLVQTPQKHTSIISDALSTTYQQLMGHSREDVRSARFANMTSQDFSNVRNSLQQLNLPTRNDGIRQNNMRNSEAYALFRSQQPQPSKPIQRNKQKMQITANDTSICNKTQVINTTRRMVQNNSVSPSETKGLGYAPLTIRLFNRKKQTPGHQMNITTVGKRLSQHQTGFNMSKIEPCPLTAKASLQSTAKPIWANFETQSVASLTASRSSVFSMDNASDPGQQQHLKPVMFNKQNNHLQSSKHFSLSVENKKDWAPTELLCRSQVYSQKSLVDSINTNSIEKGGQAVQMQTLQIHNAGPQQLPLSNTQNSPHAVKEVKQIRKNKLEEFIKVSNMVLETKSLNLTDDCKVDVSFEQSIVGQENEEAKVEQLTPIKANGHVTSALPPYGVLPTPATRNINEQVQITKTQQHRINARLVINKRRSQVTDINISEHEMVANQGTQIIQEENFENISLQNEEDWSAEVNMQMQIQLLKGQKLGKTSPITKCSSKLINAGLVRQAPAIAEEAAQHLMSQTMQSFTKKPEEIKTGAGVAHPPPQSSTSTMHLQGVSHLKSQKGLLVQKGDSAESQSTRKSDHQQSPNGKTQKNDDIKGMLANKILLSNELGSHMPAQPIFSINNNGNASNKLIITRDITTAQRDKFNLKDPDRQSQIKNIRLKHSQNSPNKDLNLAINLNEHEEEEDASTHKESKTQLYKDEAAKHPTLVEALHKSKRVRIPGPIRKISKSRAKLVIPRAIADCEALIPFAQTSTQMQFKPLPVNMPQQNLQLSLNASNGSSKSNNLCNEISYNIQPEQTLKLLRDAEKLHKPSKISVESLLTVTEQKHSSYVDLKTSEMMFAAALDESEQTLRLNFPKQANIVIMPSQLVSDLPLARSSSRLSSSMREQLEQLTMPNDFFLAASMQEILPINLEFSSPGKKVQKSKRKRQAHREQSLKKLFLLNDVSAKSVSKERSKKVNFSKTVLQPMNARTKILSDFEPVMHIQQMVKTDRYGEWRDKHDDGDEVLNTDLHMIKRGPSKLEVNVQVEMKNGSSTSRNSRKNITQMMSDQNVLRVDAVSTKKEKYSEKEKQKSQTNDVITIGNLDDDGPELKIDSPPQLKMNNSKVKVSSFRRTQEKFTQKLQTKMMIINPLRTRQHTSWQQKNQVNTSIIFDQPSLQQNQVTQLNYGNNAGGIFVSPLNGIKESPMPAPTGVFIRRGLNSKLSGDLEHINSVMISSSQQQNGNGQYATNYPAPQKKPKLHKQQRFGPTMNFRTTKEESEDLPLHQMNLTGETLFNPNQVHGQSSLLATLNGFMAAKLQKNRRSDGQTSSTKMLIISSHVQLEQLEQLGLTAALPQQLSFDQQGQILRQQASASPSTPSSTEQVTALLQMADQLNITPAPYGLSSRESDEDIRNSPTRLLQNAATL